ncbi:trifunctional serine/threonine-protein kinase/ATP-binding protein/sensor histidine kinase [Bradyrhizobium sp. McL0616]|uniref:trifunctional serine/threonine-protein kinase/ATP-binding protein/sensor histidine kinase n=1 Tax=Bradyrhizobium sp. McL0616 TaxID=3415674 RepID=UPI003CEEE851
MDLAGYELEPLRDDGEFTLHRARHPNNPVRVLALVAARSTLVKRLENEYALADALDSNWAARPLALVRYNGSATLVLEDCGGEPLSRLPNEGLEPSQFLRLAIRLATVVGQVHRCGLIHKDIKPANMLVDAAGNVRLTGFGIASRLLRERQAAGPPDAIAGTFAYMAPEQTGRMNRSIDARSDLYSLGISLYEMLTGVLPFTATDPMEWIHCHVARLPVAPVDRVGAEMTQLASIVMKLLAKNAEDRYQTAEGLAADLQLCLEALEANRRIEPFALGAHDGSDRLPIPEKLYGREAEIDALAAAFDQVVSHGMTEFVVVSGYPGVGKSSIVSELHKSLAPSHGLFAAGKFDQYKRNIPYATLAEACQSLVRQILATSEPEVSRWRQVLLEALGANGQLMVNLIPELALIIGAQQPIPELSTQDGQHRFQLAFRRLIGVFARHEHPLVLFLDDLQWLDAASLDLLEHLATHPEVRHLLLIGAYRDNEVGPTHPLKRSLALIQKAGAPITQIDLAPLGSDDVGRLVADALHCDPDVARPLAQLVHEKTDGNPFFTIQFLTALADERLIAFDQTASAWRWDIERIRAKGFTDNVVGLMIGKLQRLPRATQVALQQLACMGNSCEIAVLTKVYGVAEEKIYETFWEAVRAGLVFNQNDSYVFHHDRVQEAAYSLIAEGERAAAHHRIGETLLSMTATEELEENIFEIVNQFDRGMALITNRDQRERVAELNLMAGKRAKAASAYASALAYFSEGCALLANDKWERVHPLAFSLELLTAECEYLTGNLASSEERLLFLATRAENTVEHASVACLRAVLYTNLDRSDRAIELGLEFLQRVGIFLSPNPTAEDVRLDYERLLQRLGPRAIDELAQLPPMIHPDQCAAMSVLSTLWPPASFSDENLRSIIAIRMAIISLEHGNGDGSGYAYVSLGTTIGRRFGDYQSGYRFSKLGMELAEKHSQFKARIYQVFSNHAAPWMQHLPTCRTYVRRAFDAAQEAGDLSHAAYSCCDLVTNLLGVGDPLSEVEKETENGLDFARKAKFGLVVDVMMGQLALIRRLRGLTSEPAQLNDNAVAEHEFERRLESDPRLTKPLCCYWVRTLQAHFLAGDYKLAAAAASKAEPTLWTAPTDFEFAEYHFYGGLSRAALCDSANADQRRTHMEALSAHHRQVAVWAKNCPENFANRAALLEAEIARLEGRPMDAERLYENSIASAREYGFIQNEGVANELAAQFYLARGFRKISDAYLRDARDCYVRWGAEGKVRQLDVKYPHLRRPQTQLPPTTTTFDAPVEQLDVGTMLKASQALSGEIVLDTLIKTLMRIAVEHAGAERGILVLLRNQEPQIAAEAAFTRGLVEVTLQEETILHPEFAESALNYVIRTRERLLVDDASVSPLLSNDAHVRRRRCRSILCLPIIKQAGLVGALYLENNLTPSAFTQDRITILEFLASQAAISLETAYLYSDLLRSRAFLAEGQRMSRTGSWSWNLATGKVVWSDEHFRIFGFAPSEQPEPTFEWFLERIHWEDRPFLEQRVDAAVRSGGEFAFDFRIVLRDGAVKYVHGVGRPVREKEGDINEYIGTTIDVSDRKISEDALRKAQADLAHVTRLTTMGELAASIAHEVNQPLMAIVNNAESCLIRFATDNPDLVKIQQAVERIVKNGHRAGDILKSIRSMVRKSPSEMTGIDINAVIESILDLMRAELHRHDVSLEVDLREGLDPVTGDGVQLQQVVLNLVMNAIEAMSEGPKQPRTLRVATRPDGEGNVKTSVQDSGIGFDLAQIDRIFEPLFTTKREGMGMGLSICRSIIEAHGGRLWASSQLAGGSVFEFILPMVKGGRPVGPFS